MLLRPRSFPFGLFPAAPSVEKPVERLVLAIGKSGVVTWIT
jgi:hypothetical protein